MGLQKMVATDALLAAAVANPEADFNKPEFGFDLATNEVVSVCLAKVFMCTPTYPCSTLFRGRKSS